MRTKFFVALILSVVFVTAVFADERKIQLKWEELADAVQGKKVQMILRNGDEVEGKVQSVQPQALELNVTKATSSYEKGPHSIPRAQVSVLRYEGRSGPWRAIGTAIGAGAGTFGGVAAYSYGENEANEKGGAILAAGLIGGGAGLGYLFGRSVDRHAFVISIID